MGDGEAAGTGLRLEGIFYARFHPERGPSVIVQEPEGSIATRTSHDNRGSKEDETASEEHLQKNIVNFSEISSFVIPPYDLCGKSLHVRVEDGLWVLGWPVSLESEAYARNRFTFNVCLVIREENFGRGQERCAVWATAQTHGMKAWDNIVRKVALFFQALELDDGILAAEEQTGDKDSTVVTDLLRKVFDQLTAYGEVCVRVDKIHTLNLRLWSPPSPKRTASKIKAWEVPLLVRPLPSDQEWTHDLVLVRIQPHLNGVNHIARIAKLAEVDMKLVKRAVRALVASGRTKLLDIFHFQAKYALTQDFGWFVQDDDMREECRRYITLPDSGSKEADGAEGEDSRLSTTHLLSLYTSLAAAPCVQDFVLAHQAQVSGIDVRRFVTFGVLKGFVRRKHKYVLAVVGSSSAAQSKLSGSKIGSGSGGRRSGEDAAKDFDRAWKKAALSSGWATPPFQVSESLSSTEQVSPEKGADGAQGEKEVSPEDEKLKGFLDGSHCLDEICVALRMSEKKVLDRLRSDKAIFGEVVVFCK